MTTVLGLLAILAPLVLAAIMIQTRRDAEQAIAKLNERVFTLSRRCDVMQDTIDRYHAARMDEARDQLVVDVQHGSERGMCSLCDQVQPDSIAAICTSSGCPRRREYDAGVRVGGAS